MVCEYKYINKGYPTDKVSTLISHHYDVVDKLKDSGVVREYKNKLFLKKTGQVGIPNEQKLNNIIKQINSDYNSKVVKKQSSTDRIVVSVDMNEAAHLLVYDEDAQLRVDKNKWESNEHIVDGEVFPSQSQKFDNHNLKNLDYETLEGLTKKATFMETLFRSKGINVNIVMDSDLEHSGQLLGTGTSKYREMVSNGSINEGDSVILINPNKTFTDTLTHEFSHLFIDIAGGINNPRIKNAIEQLRNTELWENISEIYPELNEEMLSKEVLAQAMGKPVSDLINNPNEGQVSWWTNFFNWLRDIVSKRLGINVNLVQELSKEFVSGNFETIGQQEEESQSQKDIKFEERDYNSYEGLSKIAVSKLKTILNSIQNDDKNKVREFYEKRISELLDDINKNDHKGALLRFVDEVNRQSNNLLKRMGETGEKGKIDTEFLNNVGKFNLAFSLINDVQDLIIKLEDVGDLEANSDISKKVDEAIKNHNKVVNRRKVYALDVLTEELLPYSNEVRVNREEEYRRDFNNINQDKNGIVRPRPGETQEQFEARREKYVNDKVQENWSEIVQDQRILTRDRLQKSNYDIDTLAAQIKDEKQMSPYTIKMASALLDRADTEKDLAFLETRNSAIEVFERFHKDRPQSDPQKKYENIISYDENGNGYIATNINPQFAKDLSDLTKELFEKYDSGTKEGRNNIFKERAAFKRQHFTLVKNDSTGGQIKPNSKYYNDLNKLSDAEKEMRQFLIDTIKRSDANLGGNKSLITEFNGVEIIRLPGIGKDGFEKLVSGDLVDNTIEWATGLVSRRQDDTDYGSAPDSSQSERFKNFKKVFADQAGRERQLVPIYFRDRVDPKYQSYDLLSIVLMDNYMSENYKAKTNIQNSLEVLRDITASKKVGRTSGLARKRLINGLNKDDMEEIESIAGSQSNEYKVLSSIIENRLYGIKTIDSELGEVAKTIMGLTGSIMLGFNYFSAIPNLMQGKVMNFIDSVGGEFYNRKQLRVAESKFWKDMNNWVSDIGKASPNSKSRLLHDMMNVQGEFKGLANRFVRDSRWKAMMTKSNQYAFNHMGEFYIQTTAMYAILGNIKVKNKDGQYINSEGKVVKTKEEAMSLDEAYEVKDGKLVLNENVDSTSFSKTRSISKNPGKNINGELGIVYDSRRLVNKVIADLHGQYNDEIQSAAQRTIMGKMIFMLRKWLLRGFDRRWRGAYMATVSKEDLRPEDRFFSEDLMTYQEGTYTTAIRFVKYLMDTQKQLSFTLLSSEYSQLTAHEKANIKRTVTELAIMVLTTLAAYGLKALGEDEPDEETQNLIYFAAFAFRRLLMELSTFINPLEAFQMVRSPTAALNILENMGRLLAQLFTDPFGEYETGVRKGELKLWKRTKNVLPIVNNIDRNVEEAMSFTFNMY